MNMIPIYGNLAIILISIAVGLIFGWWAGFLLAGIFYLLITWFGSAA